QELLDDPGEELCARLTLARPDQRGAADFVENRRRALLVGRIDDGCFERVDGLQFVLAAIQAKLTGVVRGRDRRRIRHVQRRQPGLQCRPGGGRSTVQKLFCTENRLYEVRIGRPCRVTEDQRRVVVAVVEKVVRSARAPPRRIGYGESVKPGECTQASRHAFQLLT